MASRAHGEMLAAWWDGRPGEGDGWEQADFVTGGCRHSLSVAHIFLLR